ncbi:TraR/DksA C4-type zinc finger protein [Lutimaribacter sp. EGI FJ00015]|uniref:TraR/DksA C4-type zinc finger protein n=1 Tax=Lutimaribacter degradans TaxID=2945989 RepID=A0ACC5ZUI3_9RHOB|nr:TraR/DksA C4-type zinc finger protein [Lutimaribacter sp. EGI FJ00013]MCM2561044.1 TraR/DksA C4-type zinc finger protein [Lutimaribacter sp. EGI FJ00013]MCO0612008.1 TraR/DksA C4-type zinc finger protein [Lutimaribacter sp. EGI FJ00015]MCO0634872.1 TraR/DksA C4-type zinc finger protein [Lutimaribacter sp. EGI FJ00014]
MTETEIERYRALLLSRLEEIEDADALGRDGQDVVMLDQQAIGRLSRQDALMNQSMAKAQKARRKAETTRLRAALGRLEDGEFGYCVDCGEEISPKRLELDPATPKCISCAQG